MKRTQTAGAAALAATVLSSCSIMYGDDADARQCKSNADCAAINAALVCNAGVCEESDAGLQQQGPRACKVDTDCENQQLCGFDGYCYDKWGCLDQAKDFTPADSSPSFRATVRRFEDISSVSFVGDLKAQACTITDPQCMRPVVANSAVNLSADKVLTVPFVNLAQNGFIGNIDVSRAVSGDAGTGGGSVLPVYYHFTSENPLVTSLTTQTELLMVDPAVFPLLGQTWQVEVDPAKATVVLQAHDCGGRKAANVSITPQGVTQFLFVAVTGKTTPVVGLTKTTEDGAALLLNMPGDNRSVVFTLKDEDQSRILTDSLSFQVRAAALNYIAYYPRRSAITRWMTYAKSQGLTP